MKSTHYFIVDWKWKEMEGNEYTKSAAKNKTYYVKLIY